MNFREAVSLIPYQPSQTLATGLVASIMRAAGHILYVTGALADENYTLTDEEVRNELVAAQSHLSGTRAVSETAPISTSTRVSIGYFIDAVIAAVAEYPDWEPNDRGPNLKDLADRTAALGAIFDTELAGIRGSDPGRTL